MDLGLLYLGLGLAAFGFFIGDGLKNFKNPSAKLSDAFDDEEEEYKLIKQNELYWVIGVSKEDAKKIIEEYPDIPHITIDGNVYYPKKKVKEWLMTIGDR
ncbi:DNA-binding protein [Ornithinibacillus halophilus]|uniref:DNA-binding protein n=1 Tax=Ornithinibacillus halophilus TaxID=930117 RepID=A0A1M5GCV0_9BACI|nr:DNA-binding protein [Ornithinibacillus halophilus]SHG01509.1 hypothetical protein SAMN05216225_101253 [Ornithinibacillus halophilus]